MVQIWNLFSLRRARPGIAVEVRWCPAHKGVSGNQKADGWAKLAAEEPDARGVEWLSNADRTGARAMPLPRPLAHLEISEKKWAEARRWPWAGGRTARRRGLKVLPDKDRSLPHRAVPPVDEEPPRADRGQEAGCAYHRHALARSYAKNDKTKKKNVGCTRYHSEAALSGGIVLGGGTPL